MLSFEKFNTYLQQIINCEKWMDSMYHLLNGGDALFENTAVSTAVDLLSEIMGDDGDWISYWMYEQNFGEKWDEHTASESDGTPILCRTTQELYDFLVRNYAEKSPFSILGKDVSTLPTDKQEQLRDAMKNYCEVCDYVNDRLAEQQKTSDIKGE